MSSYWANFAANGDSNGKDFPVWRPGVAPRCGAPVWRPGVAPSFDAT
jgi:hypothetical protein